VAELRSVQVAPYQQVEEQAAQHRAAVAVSSNQDLAGA